MSTYAFEEVEVPRGAYISWGTTTGQYVFGKVINYAPNGGVDFNGNACPQVQIELIEKAASINKEGARTDFPPGEFVVLNCGQVSLKRAVIAASLEVGDVVRIELSNLAKTGKGTVKEFALKVARGAGKQTTPAAAESANPFA